MDSSKFQFQLHLLAAFFIFIHLYLSSTLSWAAPVISSAAQATKYLQKYGYMNEFSSISSSVMKGQAASLAIKDFQRFAGLDETGMLDSTTLNMMNMPRCGIPDKVGDSGSRRKKRYALQGSKWEQSVTQLTYRIDKYSRQLRDRQKMEEEIAKAFKVWSDVTNLKFIKRDSGRVDINLRFEVGEHGNGAKFDGPGGTLAYAFFPQYGGAVYFDDEETWTLNHNYGTNLLQVAAHEFGHSLGLHHSDVKSSVMAPAYTEYKPYFTLDEDDVLGIQALYGRTKSHQIPDVRGTPNLCQDAKIDAATVTEDKRTYVFKGNYYWETLDEGIASGYPRRISEDWSGLPGNLDAALTWTNGQTFFFKKDKYWAFRNKKMDPGYPKEISVGFKGIPNNIDAALIWGEHGHSYFFKGSNYWRFDDRSEPPVSSEYPQPISLWNGLPDDIDAAVQWLNEKSYFFKGQVYYRFENEDSSPPQSTPVFWFGCQGKAAKDMSNAPLKKSDRIPVFKDSINEDHTSTSALSNEESPNDEPVALLEKQEVVHLRKDEEATPMPLVE